jgi:hypothetical protein
MIPKKSTPKLADLREMIEGRKYYSTFIRSACPDETSEEFEKRSPKAASDAEKELRVTEEHLTKTITSCFMAGLRNPHDDVTRVVTNERLGYVAVALETLQAWKFFRDTFLPPSLSQSGNAAKDLLLRFKCSIHPLDERREKLGSESLIFKQLDAWKEAQLLLDGGFEKLEQFEEFEAAARR